MKRRAEGDIVLELPEIIQMNRLVRGGIDIAGFVPWYDSIQADEQSALLYHLHVFAQQAGYDLQTWQRAITDAGLSPNDLLVQNAASFRGGRSPDLLDEFDWLYQLDSSARRRLLPLFVNLFGYAEGRVFAHETEASCNHWWHRDLLDERVVNALLADREYWRTAMRDDRAIKVAGANDGGER